MLNQFAPGQPFPQPFPKGLIIAVDKPQGWTSFDVVNKVRLSLTRRLQVKKIKVGHAGTLDPLATGLLILCVGEYTKKIESFQEMPKEYTGVFTFGATTASYDLEKPVEQTFPTGRLNDELVAETVRRQFTGPIQQIPPVFSAIKVDGKRVYKDARTGREVDIEPRTVQVESFQVSALRPVQAASAAVQRVNAKGAPIYLHPDYPEGVQCDFRVVCGKGTYIRSLAFDLGQALGTGAYLSSLRRTATGGFVVENAWQMDALIAAISSGEEAAAPRPDQ